MRERAADEMVSAGVMKHLLQHVKDNDAGTLQLLHATCRVSPAVCQAACMAGIPQVWLAGHHGDDLPQCCAPALSLPDAFGICERHQSLLHAMRHCLRHVAGQLPPCELENACVLSCSA